MSELKRPVASISLSVAIGLVLIALGGLWLLSAALHIGRFLWAFFVIVPGALLFGVGLRIRTGGEALTIPGAQITAVGLVLLLQSLTGHWASWAYAWTLVVPTAIGAALMASGTVNGRQSEVQTGRRIAIIGLIMFAVLGVLFELIIGISRSWLAGTVRAGLLIGLGVLLLLFALLPRRRR